MTFDFLLSEVHLQTHERKCRVSTTDERRRADVTDCRQMGHEAPSDGVCAKHVVMFGRMQSAVLQNQ
jgi:hypothetical protein